MGSQSSNLLWSLELKKVTTEQGPDATHEHLSREGQVGGTIPRSGLLGMFKDPRPGQG